MRSLLRPITQHPGSAALALGLALLLGGLADMATPLAPALPMLAVLALLGAAAAVLHLMRRPDDAPRHARLSFAALLALGLGLFTSLHLVSGDERGLLAARFDAPAAIQDAILGPPSGSAQETAELREALAHADAPLRARPVAPDEFLYNALLLRARDEPLRSAQMLAEYLRRAADPRPDALILHAGLLATGLPTVAGALAAAEAALAPPTRAHLAALGQPPRERSAALAALFEADPNALLAAAELARALLAAAGPQGPTIATARRIAAALDALEDPDRAEPFAARFLDPAGPARLGQELADLAWLRDVAARRLGVTALAPPPGMPNAPILLRVTPPEPATAVQYVRTQDAQGEIWADVPQRTDDTREAARDPVPTLRLMRPWRPGPMRFRHLDRDGVASEPVEWEFDPAQAIREAAQRQLQRQGVFALYQPGRVAAGRLNPLPIAGQFRPGLIAVEWHTDNDRRARNVPVFVPDEVILAGEIPRALVEFQVSQGARSLVLLPIFADGARGAAVEMPIR